MNEIAKVNLPFRGASKNQIPISKVAAIIGDELKYAGGLRLRWQFPLGCDTRLIRNGIQVAADSGQSRGEFAVREPGVYRLEAWLTLDGERRPWIFANPIYIR